MLRKVVRLARVSLLSLAAGLCKKAVWLFALALSGPAMALVGPAREAPEFAPYAVMVMTRSGGEADFCTAGVIARDVVLTAAHCVTDVADTQVFFWADNRKLVVVDVASIAINPGFKPNVGRRHQISIDLALVRLTALLPSEFKPLEFAPANRVAIGQKLRIIGFGRASEVVSGTSGVLRSGTLAVSGPKSPLVAFLVDPNRTGLGGCTGDSGAPILALDQPTLVAVAIRAKGAKGYFCGASTEAVLLGPQLPWIRETLRSWGAAWSMAQ